MEKILAAAVLALAIAAQATTVTNSNGTLSITNPPNLVSLAWDPNPNQSFSLYWGSASRTYTNVITGIRTNFVTVPLGSKTSATNTFFFAVTDTDPVTRLESDYSVEVSYTPPAIQPAPTGVKAPLRLTLQQKTSLQDFQWVDTSYQLDVSPLDTFAAYRVSIAQLPPTRQAQVRPAIAMPPVPR